jgi:diamine N-acetyltransferase
MLQSSKILLRIPEPSDAAFMLAIENDERYWHLSNNQSPYSLADIEDFIRHSTANLLVDKQIRLVIVEQSTGEKAGLIDLFEYDPIHSRVGTGMIITEPFRQRGLGIEALRLIIRWLFDVVNVQQLWSNVLSNNEASMKLFKKAGFETTGVKKHWVYYQNEYCDETFLQLFNTKTTK